jgi:sorting nexin-1/2
MASIGQTIAGPRFYETDEVKFIEIYSVLYHLKHYQWFDRQKAYLDSLESQLRGLAKAIELVAKCRSGKKTHMFLLHRLLTIYVELAAATGEFSQTVSDLSSSDVGKQLSHSLAGLADVERKAQELQSKQSQQDMVTLMSTGNIYNIDYHLMKTTHAFHSG